MKINEATIMQPLEQVYKKPVVGIKDARFKCLIVQGAAIWPLVQNMRLMQ